MTPELDKIALEVRDEIKDIPYRCSDDSVKDFARRLVAKLSEGQEPVCEADAKVSGEWAHLYCYTTPPLRQPDAWKEAVIDELVICHILSSEHENNPRKAIKDLIGWNVEIALDPSVSEAANDLIQRGKASSQPDAEVIEAMRQAVDALDIAESGVTWYIENSKEANNCDDEALAIIGLANTNLRAAINKLENKNDQG